MRGDEAQSDGAPDEAPSGPRHAAPRRSLLSKLHMPAGKAMALAAMPTAVLVGMGLAPRIALADDKADIPFAPGPCVTRSDEPPAEETTPPEATQSPEPTASATSTPDVPVTPSPTGSAGDEPSPGATTDAGEPGRQHTAVPAPQTTTAAPAAPVTTPSPATSYNPLDPLGVGDALGDLFHLPGRPAAPAAATGPEATTEPAAPGATAAPDATGGTVTGSTPAATPDKPATRETTDPAADAAKEAIRNAAEQAGATTEELPDSAKGLDATTDTDIPDGAKPRFPCPEPDPEALAAAKLEPDLALLPDDPWTLESTLLTLNGLDYKGIVEVKTGSGKIKKVLKFTASSVDIKDLHQMTVGPAGTTGHVKSRPGSTSTIRDGEVTMYTEELKGNLFGLIPITFSPQTPPPLNVPFAFFTNVKVTQAGQFGGTLSVPGLENYLES
ncbi:hypothetical protein ACGFRB_09335 [Streptomyces sp. NPDC048718]|uniref:hypothetical protein n=1 Tax=Streptomyces sp. NPDC048718 TaxID=3365587 RepID=UPI00371FDBEA